MLPSTPKEYELGIPVSIIIGTMTAKQASLNVLKVKKSEILS